MSPLLVFLPRRSEFYMLHTGRYFRPDELALDHLMGCLPLKILDENEESILATEQVRLVDQGNVKSIVFSADVSSGAEIGSVVLDDEFIARPDLIWVSDRFDDDWTSLTAVFEVPEGYTVEFDLYLPSNERNRRPKGVTIRQVGVGGSSVSLQLSRGEIVRTPVLPIVCTDTAPAVCLIECAFAEVADEIRSLGCIVGAVWIDGRQAKQAKMK
jgi:hypothetical protein